MIEVRSLRISKFILFLIIIFKLSTLVSLEAFEIQFPGDDGFYIGKPMIYVITANSNDDKTIGQEGTFIFGINKVKIGGLEYYDCTFGSENNGSHFYLGIDYANKSLTQKSIKFGQTKLEINPAISLLKYPIYPGQKWNENTSLVAENVVIPGLGMIPTALRIDNIKAETLVSAQVISSPAGTFNTLLVETTYNGNMIGIPMTLIQRTWLNEDNVIIKRNFEFTKPSKLMLYEIVLSKPNPNPYDLNWDGIVNILDLIHVAKFFGKSLQRIMIPNPDIDNNSFVDLSDLKIIGDHLGETYNK